MPRLTPSRKRSAGGESAELLAALPRLPDRVLTNAYDVIYRRLRRLVVTRRVPAGTQLLETEIATALGTSRTPVRDALRRLEADGLAVRHGKGLVTASITPEGAAELIGVRADLEVMAVQRAMRRATADTLGALVTTVEGLERDLATARDDPDAFNDTHLRIHRAFFALAFDGSIEPLVMNHLVVFVELATQYRSRYVAERAHAAPSHAQIAQAMADGDADAARSLVRRHAESG